MPPNPPSSPDTESRSELPFGQWPSPISIDDVVRGASRHSALLASAGLLWSTETRPADEGRTALCVRVPGAGGVAGVTVLGSPWNIRNRVHEYGGGCLATDGRRLWVCEDATAAIHEIALDGISVDGVPLDEIGRRARTGADLAWPDGTRIDGAPLVPGPETLLHAEAGCRYADLCWSAHAGGLLAICEDHRGPGEAVNRLVVIAVDGAQRGQLRVLASGADFYSNPCPSPDGRWLAWLAWNHPCMPWDGTELWCAPLVGGFPGPPRRLAGGTAESIFQPAWSPDGHLHCVSDRSGWWNLYRCDDPALPVLQPLCPMERECATPQWEFGMRSYGFLAGGDVLMIARSEGRALLGRIPAAGGGFAAFDRDWTEYRALQIEGERAWCLAASPLQGEILVEIDSGQGTVTPLMDPDRPFDPRLFSVAEAVQYPGSGGVETHAFFYRPRHPDLQGPSGTPPPLIVINHGGPTSATTAAFRLSVQFWTSRGFALLDINYGGSSGYGRAYRERLRGQWGIVDVEDAAAGVRWLAARGEIDPARAAIRGSSAGGYTTLAALTFHQVFAAGVSLYGIGDLALLAADTHKFESRYMDTLVAPWPAGRAVYAERSPLAHVDRLSGALLLLQGEEDKVVPPNQTRQMFEAAQRKGLPVACLMFPGEQHGFRRAETVSRALAAELYFYGRIFDFRPAGDLPPVEIFNLPDASTLGS